MPDHTVLTGNDEAAWKMTRRYHRIRAEMLLGGIQAKSVVRLTDVIEATLEEENSDHLKIRAEFALYRSEAFEVLALNQGAARAAGRRFAIALNILGLLRI